MSEITTISVIPPMVAQFFNRALLTYPTIGFNAAKLWRTWCAIRAKVLQSLKHHPDRKRKGLKLIKKLKELHERAKKKEKELEGQNKSLGKRPFYYPELLNKRDRNLFDRLEFRALRRSVSSRRKDDALPTLFEVIDP